MKLVKEIEKTGDYEKTIKYNQQGQVQYVFDYGYDGGYTQEHFYNSEDKLGKILECRTENNFDRKFLTVYEYSVHSYRALTYKTHERSINEINIYENLALGEQTWNNVDELVSVHEFKYDNDLLISERYSNLADHRSYHYTFTYKDGLRIKEARREADGILYTTNYTYENGKPKSQERFQEDKFCDKTVYRYENGLLVNSKTFKLHDNEEFLASEERHWYDIEDKLCRTEKYGRYKSELILYKVLEITRTNNIATTTYDEIFCFEHYQGYYDQDTMFLELPDVLKKSATESMFDIASFDHNEKIIEAYDHKGNIIDCTVVNPETAELYERIVYHYEYNKQDLIEFIVTLKQSSSDGHFETSSVKKYYYSED